MYSVLCKAIDDVIDDLEKIPLAYLYAKKLQAALLEAEEIYVETTSYLEESASSKIIELKVDTVNEKLVFFQMYGRAPGSFCLIFKVQLLHF